MVKALATIRVVAMALMTTTLAAANEDVVAVEYTASFIAPGCAALLAGRTVEDLPQGRCLGMVETLVVVGPLLPVGRAICRPNNTPMRQAAQIVVSYIDARPARGRESFWEIADEALASAWPCKRGGEDMRSGLMSRLSNNGSTRSTTRREQR
jgi:hypothetical protein